MSNQATEQTKIDFHPAMNPALDPDTGRAFGRRQSFDPRNMNYLARVPRLASLAPELTKKEHFTGEVLDQKDFPHCVAFSGVGLLRAGPVRNLAPVDTLWLYNECQANDEWEGTYDGTSVLALMRVLKREGYVSEYNWAYDAQTTASWLLTVGPVVVGTSWRSSMSNPEWVKQGRDAKDAWLKVEGWNKGGHAYLLKGVNLEKRCPFCQSYGAVRMQNSWGIGFGHKGKAWMCLHCALEPLIKDYGEVAMVREVKKPKGV